MAEPQRRCGNSALQEQVQSSRPRDRSRLLDRTLFTAMGYPDDYGYIDGTGETAVR